MRKFCACLSLLSFSLFLSACQVITTLRGNSPSPDEPSASSPTPNESLPSAAPSSTPEGENTASSNCILLSFEEKQIVVEMQNNSAASDFMEQLPLTLLRTTMAPKKSAICLSLFLLKMLLTAAIQTWELLPTTLPGVISVCFMRIFPIPMDWFLWVQSYRAQNF